jgi:hypothetical protein
VAPKITNSYWRLDVDMIVKLLAYNIDATDIKGERVWVWKGNMISDGLGHDFMTLKYLRSCILSQMGHRITA